ncbi:uncharacterized protein TM35_000261700 [Trypanosoma theileri]|uniref:Uncharacterized protein n=1 Tax=Trypanosoma theileri TaxID=67003 RepID=A0A1X0NQD4_9TRYP|nr:uncharacterized protein TM35_000261700 [Trypanosoma theileri]ORC86718.1 hypothetical protein TM35_000261700 [Trypanosoma theileri]
MWLTKAPLLAITMPLSASSGFFLYTISLQKRLGRSQCGAVFWLKGQPQPFRKKVSPVLTFSRCCGGVGACHFLSKANRRREITFLKDACANKIIQRVVGEAGAENTRFHFFFF